MDFLGSSSLNHCKKTSLVGCTTTHTQSPGTYLSCVVSLGILIRNGPGLSPCPWVGNPQPHKRSGLFTMSCQRSPIVLVGIFGKGGFVYDREEKVCLRVIKGDVSEETCWG